MSSLKYIGKLQVYMCVFCFIDCWTWKASYCGFYTAISSPLFRITDPSRRSALKVTRAEETVSLTTFIFFVSSFLIRKIIDYYLERCKFNKCPVSLSWLLIYTGFTSVAKNLLIFYYNLCRKKWTCKVIQLQLIVYKAIWRLSLKLGHSLAKLLETTFTWKVTIKITTLTCMYYYK